MTPAPPGPGFISITSAHITPWARFMKLPKCFFSDCSSVSTVYFDLGIRGLCVGDEQSKKKRFWSFMKRAHVVMTSKPSVK
jgi:hypothetical protein